MENKRGQFYLVAAIVIIIALIGLATLTNYVVVKRNENVVETTRELQLEGENVINWGIVNSGQIDILLGNFADEYGEYVEDDFEFIFIYGNEELIKTERKVNVKYSEEIESSISLELGGDRSEFEIIQQFIDEKIINVEDDNTINVNIGGTQYDPITLKEGQNFYFIIQQPKEKADANN